MGDWILLRVPRTSGATTMSGVRSDGQVARGATIAEVCDALSVPGLVPTLIFPLDGRHLIAGYALDEATKRGWAFSRHVPAGQERYLFDLDGADAAATLSADEAVARLQELLTAMAEAWNDDELGESMGIGRQGLTMCLARFGAWHAYTFLLLANFFQAAAGTGAEDNITEACGITEFVLGHPRPATVPGAGSAIVKLEELARRCAEAGRGSTAALALDARAAIAG